MTVRHPLFELGPTSPVIVQGISGRMGRRHAKLMRAYGTNVVGGTSSRPDDNGEFLVRGSVREAVDATGAVASIAMTPPLDTLSAATEAFEAGIKTVITIAEGVPVHDALRLRSIARSYGGVWLGASTPGMAVPNRFKIGFVPDIALRPGSFSLISKSGTLSYEIGYRLASLGLGQSIWIGVGGDAVKGLRFADLLEPLLVHEPTQAIILIGEVGGSEEEEFAAAVRARGGSSKPVVALLAGREAKEGVSMGHAGAITYGDTGTMVSKIKALGAAGITVASTIGGLIDICRDIKSANSGSDRKGD